MQIKEGDNEKQGWDEGKCSEFSCAEQVRAPQHGAVQGQVSGTLMVLPCPKTRGTEPTRAFSKAGPIEENSAFT